MKISVCLATYNGEKFLKEQLNSIFTQNYENWQLLIHDDNSMDDTINIIKIYEKKYPDKIKFIDDTICFNSASENFSFLLEQSNADYIMFCDQDDVWLSEKIELTLNKMLEVEKSNPNIPILIHSDLKVVNEDLTILSDSYWSYQNINPNYDTLNRLLVNNVITGCTVMINKKLADMALPIPKEAIMHDWWLGLVASAFGQIHHMDTPTILYRQHGKNDTGATPFNYKTVLNQAKALSTIDLNKYVDQAIILLQRHYVQLTEEQKLLLTDFISIKHSTWLESKQILIKHKILKQTFIRNIGLLLCR